MRMHEIINVKEAGGPKSPMTGTAITPDQLSARYPGIESDLQDAAGWIGGLANFSFATEPLGRFKEVAERLLAYQRTVPKGASAPREEAARRKDRARTAKIVKAIQGGATPWPIFVDTDDGFVLEGRHRLVAFLLLGLAEVPVVYATKVPTP